MQTGVSFSSTIFGVWLLAFEVDGGTQSTGYTVGSVSETRKDMICTRRRTLMWLRGVTDRTVIRQFYDFGSQVLQAQDILNSAS